MTYTDLHQIFGRYLSRNEANLLTALDEAGYSYDQLEYLIEIGAVKVLDFGYGQIHYERGVSSERAFEKLLKPEPCSQPT